MKRFSKRNPKKKKDLLFETKLFPVIKYIPLFLDSKATKRDKINSTKR